MRKPTFAVVGAGCGGLAVAGYLAFAGYDVALCNRSWDRIALFRDRGYVELEGEYEGIGELSYIGTDLARALADRDVIMIVTTATGHRPLAERMAPHLRDGQIILLNPGRTFGALEVWHVLRERGCTADVSRRTARFLARVDDELQTLARALDSRALSVTEWLESRYGLERADIYTMLHSNPSYQNVKAPTTLDHRYLWEDIPTGLVPISAVASALGIETPAVDHLIDEGSLTLGRNFREAGRTLAKLGLTADRVKEELTSVIRGENAVPEAAHA